MKDNNKFLTTKMNHKRKELNFLNGQYLDRNDGLCFYAMDIVSDYTIQEDSINCIYGGYTPLFGLSVFFYNMTDREIKEFLHLYSQGEFCLKTSWYDPYIIVINRYDHKNGRLYLSGYVNNWYFTELSPSPLAETADQIVENILFWYAQSFEEGSPEQDEVIIFCEDILNSDLMIYEEEEQTQ